jgi:hypothetical protein
MIRTVETRRHEFDKLGLHMDEILQITASAPIWHSKFFPTKRSLLSEKQKPGLGLYMVAQPAKLRITVSDCRGAKGLRELKVKRSCGQCGFRFGRLKVKDIETTIQAGSEVHLAAPLCSRIRPYAAGPTAAAHRLSGREKLTGLPYC